MIFLYCQYEIVNYGYRPLMMWWRFATLLYGGVLVALGVIIFAVEMGRLGSTTQEAWDAMSANQQAFFSNSMDNLKAERAKNAGLCGAFAIIIGGFVILSGISQTVLYSETEVKWRAPNTSRLPIPEVHEKVEFVYECYRDEDYDGPHHQLSNNTQLNQEEGEAEAQSDNEDLRREEEAARMAQLEQQQQADMQNARLQYGSMPGQSEYEDYNAAFGGRTNNLGMSGGFRNSFGRSGF